jgi:carboxylesterase
MARQEITTLNNQNLHNAHLDGDSFFMQAGEIGIFLSHGYSATTAEVRLVAEKLHDAGYTVAAPLLPGHGTTPKDLNQTPWQDWVKQGEASLAELFKVCNQVWVAGESMGGVLALYLASQYPNVQGVILYAPAIRLKMTFLDTIKVYLGSLLVSDVPRDSLDCNDTWQGYPGVPLKGVIQLLRFQKATLPELAKITQPILIFQGRLDGTVAENAGDVIFDAVSSTVKEHHWMEKSSHAIVLDVERDAVANLSMEFIAKYGA